MAGSQYAYVRNFELPDPVLPNVYMVVRIDGKGFHRFSDAHGFAKPNDGQALELMNEAARHVLQTFKPDVVLAFGESDEYSFLLRKSCQLYKRRASKILTQIVSLFTSAYVFGWHRIMGPRRTLLYPPTFDGRLVAYPSTKEVRDYFAWRQADTHINNLYNTTFWALVHGDPIEDGLQERRAHERLKGTVSSEKNEILFAQYGINYDKLEPMFRKGTTIVWGEGEGEGEVAAAGIEEGADTGNDEAGQTRAEAGGSNGKKRTPGIELRTLHVDIIGKDFWTEPSSTRKAAVKQSGEVRGTEPWQDPRRVVSYQGLGLRALER